MGNARRPCSWWRALARGPRRRFRIIVPMVGRVKGFLLSPYLYLVIRVALGLVFVWAGGIKLMDPRAFARVLSGYEMIPGELLAPVAIGLPLIELLAGLGLVFNVRGGLGGVAVMLAMFLLALGFGIYQDLDIDCGCFSAEEIHAKSSLRTAFLRDLGLMACALYLFTWKRAKARKVDLGEVLSMQSQKGGI